MNDDQDVIFEAGKPFLEEVTAGKLNRLAGDGAEVRRRANRDAGGGEIVPQDEHWIGKVVAAGPDGEADLTGRQYWVERQAPTTSLGFGAEFTLEQDKTPATSGATKTIVKATHVTVAATGGAFTGTRLSAGEPVHIFSHTWDALPTPQTFYYFLHEVRFGPGIADLTQTSGSRGTATTAASWVYTVKYRGETDTLLTNASPAVRRHPAAANAATIGLIFTDKTGVVTLIEAFEPRVIGSC